MKRIHILYGQGGYPTSIGMHNFGKSLDPKEYKVTFWPYGDWAKVAKTIQTEPCQKVAVIGYSLGANAAAWLQFLYPQVTIDLLVGYDPTANGPPLSSYKIGANVKRCLCYQQTSWIGTSMLFGRGLYIAAPGLRGLVEVTQFRSDHLAVPFNSTLHNLTRKALEIM